MFKRFSVGRRGVQPALLLATALFAVAPAYAACDTTGTVNVVNCGNNERIDATATAGPATLEVSGEQLATTGTDDNGYLTFSTNGGPLDIELALTDGTTIDSDEYLAVDVRTTAGGDIKVATEEGVTLEAEQTGVYARAATVGDIEIINYATIHAGIGTGAMPSDGIHAVSNGGATRVENYAHVESDNGRGIVADGGYVDGVEKVSIYNEGRIESFGDGLRVNAGGLYGADAEIINKGNVTGQDRRGIVAWSASGDARIENTGEVTSYGGQAIYGMADAGKVTIINDNKLRVYDSDPSEGDLNDESFAGIEAAVDGTGDIEVSNFDDGDILSYDHGIYAHTGGGSVKVSNDGVIVSDSSAIMTLSEGGDVAIDNTGELFADGISCLCGYDMAGAVAVEGADLGAVEINNKAGGVIVANADLAFTPTAEWLNAASLSDLSHLAFDTSSYVAVSTYLTAADSITVTNDGTIIGGIALSGEENADLGVVRIENNGLWVTSAINGVKNSGGLIANSGRLQSLGVSLLYASVENSGDIVVSSLDEATAGPGAVVVYGNYDATGEARLVLDWPDESLVGYAPALAVAGEVTGSTEVVIGRGEALADFDWDGTLYVPLVQVMGTENADAGHFYMEDTSYGMLTFKLAYDDSDGQLWFLTFDTNNDGTEALAEIPFAARNLFKLATEGVSDRLDELRNAYAANRGFGGPMGYAASPDDPVTAALSISTPERPTTNAWLKTTGRYGQGDGYDVLSAVIEAGIDTLVDTGAGPLAYGAFGGTGASQMSFDLADTDATLSGPLLGTYANYSSDRAFLGVIAAVQTLTVDATLSGVDTNFGGLSYGGRVDAGYRFGDELIIEPAVALAASHTEFDTFEMNAMNIGFVDTGSFAAEARVRVAREFAFDGASVTPFAVATLGNDFLGGDGVDAPSSDVLMGNNGGLYGDFSAGVTVANEDETLSGFAKGNLGYAAGEVSGGVRLGANAAF